MSKKASKKRKNSSTDSEEKVELDVTQPKELSYDNKMTVLHKCIPHASILLAKQGVTFSRDAQNKIWNNIANECGQEGIEVGDGIKLKNTVRNWFNRVSVSLHFCIEFE